jgi:hypothetical protein
VFCRKFRGSLIDFDLYLARKKHVPVRQGSLNELHPAPGLQGVIISRK